MFTERSYLYIYIYIDARAIHSTSVGLAQARPNNNKNKLEECETLWGRAFASSSIAICATVHSCI